MENQLIKEVKAELSQCLKQDVYERNIKEIKAELRQCVKKDMENQLIKEVKAELSQCLKKDVYEKEMKELKEMMKSFQRTMIIVEDAVTNKIPALFDGYSMHQQKQEELEEKVENLEQVTQTHSIRIAALETISSNDAKRLSKMSS